MVRVGRPGVDHDPPDGDGVMHDDSLRDEVRRVYRTFLEREPEPAEIERVVAALDSGAVSHIEFALSVHDSPEASHHRTRPPTPVLESDMLDDAPFGELLHRVREYSMTSVANLYAAFDMSRHLAVNGIEGDIVECGVWRGGMCMMIALTLARHEEPHRALWMYDTYTGMTEPTGADRRHDGVPASDMWVPADDGDGSTWWPASIDEVQQNMAATGYPAQLLHLVKGRVEDTIPRTSPTTVAMLRLDTDWYDSTFHELVHLYPLLVPGGALIIDDYGWWRGSKQAVDDYFDRAGSRPFLSRIDAAGARLAINPSPADSGSSMSARRDR